MHATTTIADLHHSIQIAFGWTDSHLHRFVIYGKDYGIAYRGGISFADEPTQVRLADFRFRTHERFTYEYDFHDRWQHEISIEPGAPYDPHQCYPICIGGARAVPPEEWGGPRAFLAFRQHFHPLRVIEESTVNQVISTRMVKKQQMRWTKRGAHLLLQDRAQVLNDDLRTTFARWYPAMTRTNVSPQMAA